MFNVPKQMRTFSSSDGDRNIRVGILDKIGWRAAENDEEKWYMFDLNTKMQVVGLVTQGKIIFLVPH